MKEKFLRIVLSFSLILWLGALALIAGQAPQQQPASRENSASKPAPRLYSKDISELRTRFNQDKGKVRLVVILSPT